MNWIVDPSANRTKAISLVIGVIGLAGCVIGWIMTPRDFFVAYLFGEVFFIGLSLGSLCLLMIHHLTNGYWGYGVRRFLEAAVGNLPLLALLFVPIFFGLSELYPWRHPTIAAAHELLEKKQGYLNMPGFIVRTVVVFATWIIISRLLLKWSAQQDVTVSVQPTRKMRTLSGPGLVIYPITMTFAAVDWIMSMEAEWYSTMFPVLICIGQVLGALALMILLFAWAAESPQLSKLAGEDTFHKIGNLLLAFTMLWAYLAFGQLLIVWSGNLPSEISWYLHRISGGWRWVASFIALFQFFVPFFLLLMRPVKKKRHLLAMIAGCVFVSHIVTIWWTIAPSIYSSGFYVSWLAFAAFVGIGGLWWATFLWNVGKRQLVPLNDPRFALAVPV
jgi:hypothetical protein